MSGGGAVALGSSVTITNAGVTSVAAGTGISVSASTGGVTITNTSPGGGGVTSAVAGNGVAVSGATGAVTFSASCPTFNTVGSYAFGGNFNTGSAYTFTSGTNYSAGTGANQLRSISLYSLNQSSADINTNNSNNLSGTWKWMGSTVAVGAGCDGHASATVICRVA